MTVIADYIAAQEAIAQPHLTAIYRVLQATLPEAEERISYGMPAFWQQRVLVYFGAQKTHLDFYPTAAPIAAYAEALRSCQTSKGAIQFPYDRPLPVELIAELARYRLTHQTTRTSAKRRPPVAVPEAIAEALAAADLTQAYAARPQYQRTDYLNWIARAK